MELSIIIIEYHCMDQVIDCVQSINDSLNSMDIECIIVSNSEYSESVIDELQKKFHNETIINTKANLGYAGGVNKGLAVASGRFVYVINPDCLLIDNGIIDIIARMDKDKQWAISGPMVVDENSITQPSCRSFPKPWTFLLVRSIFSMLPGSKHEYVRYFMKDFDHKSSREVDWVSGGATLIKYSALKDIGGMDERYFLYMEDVDWCRSAWESGYKVMYCPSSKVIHAGQHQSIKFGLNSLKNVHMRWHLKSLFKYFMKYKFKPTPDTEYYMKFKLLTK